MGILIDQEQNRSVGRFFNETRQETEQRMITALASLHRGKEFLKEVNEDPVAVVTTRPKKTNAHRIADAMKDVYVQEKAVMISFTAPHVVVMENVVELLNNTFGKFHFEIFSSSTIVTKITISFRS
jgi:hypothetical protein